MYPLALISINKDGESNEEEYTINKEKFFSKNKHLKEFANLKLIKRKKSKLLNKIK